MNIKLYDNVKIKKGCIIIEGFPGFGLVGTIAAEFLIEHLKTKQIGEFEFDELPATIAIHKGSIVNPMAIHYSEKYNLLIMHTILNVKGFEWQAAEQVDFLAKKLKSKEIISLEGVNALVPGEEKVFYFGEKKFGSLGAEAIKESVIVGVTAALLLRNKKVNCLFAPTTSALPDSKAAAAIINMLDKYLGLEVDTAPLLEQAKAFEDKLKGIMSQTQKAVAETDKKNLSYLG